MLNAYSTLLLEIFLLVLIVLIVSALTVRKKKKVNAQNYDKNRKDKAWLAGMKAYSKAYIRNNKRIKSNARIAYKINRKNKLAAASALSKLRPGYVQEKFKKWYNRNKSSKQLKARRYSKLMYSQNPLLKKRESERALSS